MDNPRRNVYEANRKSDNDEFMKEVFLATIQLAVDEWKKFFQHTKRDRYEVANNVGPLYRAELIRFFNSEICDMYLQFAGMEITAENIRVKLNIPTMDEKELKRYQLLHGVY